MTKSTQPRDRVSATCIRHVGLTVPDPSLAGLRELWTWSKFRAVFTKLGVLGSLLWLAENGRATQGNWIASEGGTATQKWLGMDREALFRVHTSRDRGEGKLWKEAPWVEPKYWIKADRLPMPSYSQDLPWHNPASRDVQSGTHTWNRTGKSQISALAFRNTRIDSKLTQNRCGPAENRELILFPPKSMCTHAISRLMTSVGKLLIDLISCNVRIL